MEREKKNHIGKKTQKIVFLFLFILLVFQKPILADGYPHFSSDVPLPPASQWISNNYDPMMVEFFKFLTILAGATIVKTLIF